MQVISLPTSCLDSSLLPGILSRLASDDDAAAVDVTDRCWWRRVESQA